VSQTVNASTCSVFILAGAHFAQTAPNVESGQAFEEALFKQIVYPNSLRRQKTLAKGTELDSGRGMVSPGFLSREERSALVGLARDGSVANRLALHGNAWRCSTRA
jgi:hypothetical protein